MKIKAGDTVLVRAGKDKGLEGTVLKVYPESGRVLVEGVNRVVRHQRVTPGQGGSKAGGLITKEAAIHVSNVMLVGDDGKATRAGSREETVEKTRADGSTREVTRRIRIGRRSGKDV
ncbi:MAG: 50S ribosomal protein L24 [Actinobacteria bacterium]|nr:50S ribosomal protein L24 [Actinomycetota bacterium]MCB9412012.1 50S ribosomal protein L24 [Actinomycetota bacterium]